MNWPLVQLDDLCVRKTGTADPSKAGYSQFLYIDISSVDADRKEIAAMRPLLGAEAPSRARRTVAQGDVILSMTRPNLNAVAMIKGEHADAICSTGFCVLRCKPDLHPSYLFHFVKSPAFVEKLTALTSGALYPAVTEGQVRAQKIPLPPLDVQQRIVDILDRAASIQRLRQAADEKLKQLIPALFVDMFGDPARNPKGLSLVKLGDLIERIETGKNVTAGSGKSEYRILKVSAVTSGAYKEHESKPAPDDQMVVQNHIVREGDFLFSRANTVDLVGATAIVQQTNGKTLLPDKLWRIRWHKNVDPHYMLAVMQNTEIRVEMGRASSGTSASMRNISQGRLATIEVPLASFEQQQQFGRIAEALTAKTSLSQQASQHAQSAAASLTQSVFGS
jgi:type I restriction enzyme S subunit